MADKKANPKPRNKKPTDGKPKPGAVKSKRVNVELAPGTYLLLENYIETENGNPDRTRAHLTYTDVINQALEQWLSRRLGGQG